MIRVPLAIAGEAAIGSVDEFGYVTTPDGWRIEWWIVGDDYWHVPAASTTVRQRSVDHTPVIETAMRVPGGDVVHRVAAVAAEGSSSIAVEIENNGTIPVAVGIALVAPAAAVTANVAVDGPAVRINGDVRIRFAQAPRGEALNTPAAANVALFVHPVAHGTTWRCVIGRAAPSVMPDLAAVARGWLTHAAQHAQIVTGDGGLDDALVAARTSLLLHAGSLIAAGKSGPTQTSAAVADGLELLGYQDEAGTLRRAARRRPARRGLPLVGGNTPRTPITDDLALLSDVSAAAGTVMAIRDLVVRDDPTSIDCLPGYTGDWRGRSVEVTNLPTNEGLLSYAVRWHGEHPALLWDAPAPLTAGAIDTGWSAPAGAGEGLVRSTPAGTAAGS